MMAFVAVREKPHIYAVMGMWVCTGIRLRWGVYEDICIGIGATPVEAHKRWRQD